jgi:Type II secretion system (T2SS), protein M subtype b
MIDAISPWIRKLLALGLFILLLWMGLSAGGAVALGRYKAHAEIKELREQYAQIMDRRVDIPSLEAHLSRIGASPTMQRAVMTADSDRAALARVQQVVRRIVESSGGQLLALNEVSGNAASSPLIGVQVRLRIDEANLLPLVAALESATPRLRLDEISIVPRQQPPDGSRAVDVTTVARARWSNDDGSKR